MKSKRDEKPMQKKREGRRRGTMNFSFWLLPEQVEVGLKTAILCENLVMIDRERESPTPLPVALNKSQESERDGYDNALEGEVL